MSTAVFFANGFGDAIIARPALSALAARLEGPVHLICNRGPHGFLFDDLGFTSIHAMPMTKLPIGRAFDVAAAADLVGACDTLIDMVPWSSDHVRRLATALDAQTTVGFDHAYSLVLERNTTKNAVALAFDVPQALIGGLRIDDFRSMPRFSAAACGVVAAINDWRARTGMEALLAIQADTFAHKLWSPAGFRQVLSHVLARWPRLACAVVGANAPPLVLVDFENRILSLESLSLEASMAVVSAADYFIGIDSCMLHMADLAGVPGTGIFGPATGPLEWGYFWAPERSVAFEHGEDLSAVDGLTANVDAFLATITDPSAR